MVTENTNTNTSPLLEEVAGGPHPPVIYIGKNLEKPIWYFVSVKDGYCRFLHFGFSPLYPYWMAGLNTGKGEIYSVPDKMSPSLCPKEVWEEVKLFVEEKVKYEPIPSKKGRKASVNRILLDEHEGGKSISDPGETKRESDRLDDPPKTARSKSGKGLRRPGSNTGGSGGAEPVLSKAPESKRRRSKSVVGVDGRRSVDAVSVNASVTSSIRQRGRPRKLRELVATGVKNSNQQELIPVTNNANSTIVAIPINIQAQPVKKGRGRPRTRSLVVEIQDKTNKVEVIEVSDSKKKK